jgi:aminopeptidase N
MYYKGGNMLHTMRHILGDDARWRSVLRGLNAEFWHQTVGTEEVEAYMSRAAGFDFSRVFEQYLRTTDIPVLKYASRGKSLDLWWEGVVPGFEVPVVVRVNGEALRVTVSEKPTSLALDEPLTSFELDRNFYMSVESE